MEGLSSPISIGQTEIMTLFTKTELPIGAKEIGTPQKDLTVSFIEGQTLKQIFAYMQTEPNRERGGSLVGNYIETSTGKVAHITDFIPALNARTTGASVNFTADDFRSVDTFIKQHKPGSQFIGWVHSHPFWTPAPLRDDVFVMENFFNLPNQVTMIINQNTNELGDFRYVNGQVKNTGGFYYNPDGLNGLDEIIITSDTRLDQKTGGQKVTLNSPPDENGTVLRVEIDYSLFEKVKDKLIKSINNIMALFLKQKGNQALSITQEEIDSVESDKVLKIQVEGYGDEILQPSVTITNNDLR